MGIRKSLLLGASVLMLIACGPHMTKEEVTGGWDKSLMPIQLERFCELAKPQQPLCGGYSEVRENQRLHQ